MWKRPISELCDVLPKECLPKDYGGMEKSFLELDGESTEFSIKKCIMIV